MDGHSTLRSCLVCREPSLEQIPLFDQLGRITSDCRPFRSGGRLFVCSSCGTVQKQADARWLAEIGEIYRDYDSYRQGGGDEQIVLDPVTGEPRRRSLVLVDRLASHFTLPAVGRALDVGCGKGATLKALSERFPGWQLFGHELGAGTEHHLRRIAGFAGLFQGPVDEIDGTFDLITMIHSLEHFPAPRAALRALCRRLKPGGLLFVEVCNVEENPFDLLVADHLLHFSPATLALAVELEGLAVARCETQWVRKEISFVAQAARGEAAPVRGRDGRVAIERVRGQVDWLMRLAVSARAVSEVSSAFGMFGTSIAATWLASQLGDRVRFFVDEDPSRVGRRFMGRPTLSPGEVPAGADVYLALAPVLATSIARRLNGFAMTLHGDFDTSGQADS